MTRTKKITNTAILIALITLLTFVPIQIGPISLAVLLLIPLLVGCQTQGFTVSIILGLYTGLLSLIASYTVSTSLLRFVFNNPIVSVLPRILVGTLTYASYKFTMSITRKLSSDKLQILISSAVSSAVGVLTNTTLVLGFMFAIYNGTNFSGLTINATLIWTIVTTNAIAELIIAVIITPPVTYGIYRANKKKALTT